MKMNSTCRPTESLFLRLKKYSRDLNRNSCNICGPAPIRTSNSTFRLAHTNSKLTSQHAYIGVHKFSKNIGAISKLQVQKGDMKQVPLWGPTNIRHNVTRPEHTCAYIISGALAELRRVLASSWPSVCMELAATGRIFMKFDIWVFSEYLSKKNRVSLKSDKNNAYFAWRPIDICNSISLNSS